jgi:hypothetical protein
MEEFNRLAPFYEAVICDDYDKSSRLKLATVKKCCMQKLNTEFSRLFSAKWNFK